MRERERRRARGASVRWTILALVYDSPAQRVLVIGGLLEMMETMTRAAERKFTEIELQMTCEKERLRGINERRIERIERTRIKSGINSHSGRPMQPALE